MGKIEISLSPRAIAMINELLSDGKRVSVDVNQKTHELMIREEHSKLKYKVVVAKGQ